MTAKPATKKTPKSSGPVTLNSDIKNSPFKELHVRYVFTLLHVLSDCLNALLDFFLLLILKLIAGKGLQGMPSFPLLNLSLLVQIPA